jgi:hypothetical protein
MLSEIKKNKEENTKLKEQLASVLARLEAFET